MKGEWLVKDGVENSKGVIKRIEKSNRDSRKQVEDRMPWGISTKSYTHEEIEKIHMVWDIVDKLYPKCGQEAFDQLDYAVSNFYHNLKNSKNVPTFRRNDGPGRPDVLGMLNRLKDAVDELNQAAMAFSHPQIRKQLGERYIMYADLKTMLAAVEPLKRAAQEGIVGIVASKKKGKVVKPDPINNLIRDLAYFYYMATGKIPTASKGESKRGCSPFHKFAAAVLATLCPKDLLCPNPKKNKRSPLRRQVFATRINRALTNYRSSSLPRS